MFLCIICHKEDFGNQFSKNRAMTLFMDIPSPIFRRGMNMEKNPSKHGNKVILVGDGARWF